MSIQESTLEGVSVVRINRPEKKNALTVEMYLALTHALVRAAATDTVRVLVLLGGAGVFSAGNDLADFLARPPTGPESPVMAFLRTLANFPKPIVAAVDGHAVGIGMTMLLHCDHVLVTERAKLQMPFVRLGLVPEGASTVLLARLGQAKAAELLLLGQPLLGAQAVDFGLANELVDPSALEARAMQIAAQYAGLLPDALVESKRLMKAPFKAEVDLALAQEGESFVARLGNPETRRILEALLK
jgi:enoyl-CoA hydratase/carnithine racemase